MKLAHLAILLGLGCLAACSTPAPPYNYTEYKQSDPKSIVILPPKNSSPDVKATYSFYSQSQRPLAEAGYYVFPVSLVDETFKQNGLTVADDIHQVDISKLQQIFGADAAFYIDIKEYGTKYTVLNSAAIVSAEGKLVDLRTGKLLWEGKASASSAETDRPPAAGGLLGLVVVALVKQVIGSAADQSHHIAQITNARLLSPTPNGILYGPRNPLYKAP